MKRAPLTLAVLLCAGGAASASAATPKEKAAAKEHYDRGARYYEAGAYEQAIVEYQVAYQVWPAPEFLFNIAKAHQMKGDAASAISLFQRYLDADPRGAGSAQAKAELERLKEERAAEAPPPPSPPLEPASTEVIAAPVAPPPAPSAPRWLAPTLGAGGLGLAISGAALFVESRVRFGQLSGTCAPSCDRTLVDGPRTRESVGVALAISGAAIALGALVLWLLGS